MRSRVIPAALRVGAAELCATWAREAFSISKNRKPAYHAWGAFTSPLLIALLVTGEKVARAAGLSSAEARRKMMPIVRQTLANYAKLGPAGAFSGPIVRGDAQVVRQHLSRVEEDSWSQGSLRGVGAGSAAVSCRRGIGRNWRRLLEEVAPWNEQACSFARTRASMTTVESFDSATSSRSEEVAALRMTAGLSVQVSISLSIFLARPVASSQSTTTAQRRTSPVAASKRAGMLFRKRAMIISFCTPMTLS